MILQGSTPGVKNTEETGEIAADVLWIVGKFFDRIRGGLEQSGVSGTLVFAHKGAQVLWHREREKEMVSWELA